MAKVSKKSEKITAFGGIFFVLDKFDHILCSVIDLYLGLCLLTSNKNYPFCLLVSNKSISNHPVRFCT